MLLTTNTKVFVNAYNIKYLKLRGISCEKGDMITIYEKDFFTNTRVDVVCDYCGEVYNTNYGDYKKSVKIINKSCCKNRNCQYEKRKECMIIKYGVDNPMKVKSNVEKAKKTCLERYGVENPMQNEHIKNRFKETMTERYGVSYSTMSEDIKHKIEDSNLKKYNVKCVLNNNEIKNKIKNTNLIRYGSETPFGNLEIRKKFVHKNTIVSKQEKHIAELYNAETGIKLGKYFPDMIIDKQYICEFDGAGHALSVKFGQETEKEFYQKESDREQYMISCGYKIFRLITNKNKIPSDEKLLQIKSNAISALESGSYIYKYNLDNDYIEIL